MRAYIVYYIKLDLVAFPRVLNPKEKPLCVSIGVYVVLHQQVVLLVRHFLGQIEVTTFKPRLKQQCFVKWIL